MRSRGPCASRERWHAMERRTFVLALDQPTTLYVGGASRRIDNMKRTIVVVATTLVLTAGQAMAEGLTPPRHVNGLRLAMPPIRCICTCLDKPCDECFKCFDARGRVVVGYSTPIPGATPCSAARTTTLFSGSARHSLRGNDRSGPNQARRPSVSVIASRS